MIDVFFFFFFLTHVFVFCLVSLVQSFMTSYLRGHTNPPHPHTSDLINSNDLNCNEESSVLRAFSELLHLINSNLNLLNGWWWGWGGVGLCGPNIYSLTYGRAGPRGGRRRTLIDVFMSFLFFIILFILFLISYFFFFGLFKYVSP